MLVLITRTGSMRAKVTVWVTALLAFLFLVFGTVYAELTYLTFCVRMFAGGDGNYGHWICRMCTFINHPMLPKCEQCDMARVDISNSLGNILRPLVVRTVATRTAHQLPATHPRG